MQPVDASGEVDSPTDALAVGDGDAAPCPYYSWFPGNSLSSCSGPLTCSDAGGLAPCTWDEALALACAQGAFHLQTCTGGLTMVHFGSGIDVGEDDYYSVATGGLVWIVSTSPPSPTCLGMNPPPCVSCTDIANPCGGPADDSGVNDAAVDSAGDVGKADVAVDAPSGSEAGDGGGVDGAVEAGAVCVPGSFQCTAVTLNTSLYQWCNANGAWDTVFCGGFCGATQCTNICRPGSTQCSGSGVQPCDANGQWGSAVACATGTCNSGACTGSTTTGTSCQTNDAGLTNCGASGESCCTSLEVPGGTFYRTYTNSGSGPTGEAYPATVSGFRLDKHLVTVGRFRQFVAAWNNGSGYLPAAGSGKHTYLNGGQGLANSGSTGTYEMGWDATNWNNTTDIDPTDANLASCSPYSTWTASAGGQENLPINCVNWYESYAFCIWDGGFLPSEAEWEYAAAGGSQQREYPWGTAASGTANLYAIYDCYYPSGSASCSGLANIAPVGTATLGAGLWGQFDMAGEMGEWNLDGYATYVDPGTDCANVTSVSARVVRGGLFNYVASGLLPPNRNYGVTPSSRNASLGLRCARTP